VGCYFTVAILDFLLPITSDNHPNYSTVEMADPEKLPVAVELLFLAGMEPEIRRLFNLPVKLNVTKQYGSALRVNT
jgi:hypothetical protein